MRSPILASSLVALLAVVAVGCSSADTPSTETGKKNTTPTPAETTTPPVNDIPAPKQIDPAPTPGTEVGDETWADGKQIPAAGVSIKAGATVTITPGANVTVASGGAVTVKGTLSVKPGAAGSAHAKIGGMGWLGIVVASGGTLAVEGLDISDAGVWTQTGNTDATILNSQILGAPTPFKMEPGSKLSITKSKVTATGSSAIAGTFVASYLAYDKGSNAGLQLQDPAGTMTITDSTLTGVGGGDYVVSNSGKLVKIEYSTISGAHCGLHFGAVDQFILDHVSEDVNSYSAMLYGSGAGPNSITSSNIRAMQVNLDFSGTNGPTTIDKSFIGGSMTDHSLNPVLPSNAKITNAANAAIADAKPR